MFFINEQMMGLILSQISEMENDLATAKSMIKSIKNSLDMKIKAEAAIDETFDRLASRIEKQGILLERYKTLVDNYCTREKTRETTGKNEAEALTNGAKNVAALTGLAAAGVVTARETIGMTLSKNKAAEMASFLSNKDGATGSLLACQSESAGALNTSTNLTAWKSVMNLKEKVEDAKEAYYTSYAEQYDAMCAKLSGKKNKVTQLALAQNEKYITEISQKEGCSRGEALVKLQESYRTIEENRPGKLEKAWGEFAKGFTKHASPALDYYGDAMWSLAEVGYAYLTIPAKIALDPVGGAVDLYETIVEDIPNLAQDYTAVVLHGAGTIFGSDDLIAAAEDLASCDGLDGALMSTEWNFGKDNPFYVTGEMVRNVNTVAEAYNIYDDFSSIGKNLKEGKGVISSIFGIAEDGDAIDLMKGVFLDGNISDVNVKDSLKNIKKFGKLAEATGEYLLDNSTVDEDLKGLFRTYLKSSPVAKPILDTNELVEDYVEFKGDDAIYSEYVKNTSLMEYLYDLFVKPGTQNSGKNTEVINN